jgi:hypothetical protein
LLFGRVAELTLIKPVVALSFGEFLFRFEPILSLVAWRLPPLYIKFIRSARDLPRFYGHSLKAFSKS